MRRLWRQRRIRLRHVAIVGGGNAVLDDVAVPGLARDRELVLALGVAGAGAVEFHFLGEDLAASQTA